jgi:hypothetical protein
MMYLSKAAFEGRSSIAEKAVRDALLVEVSIHDNPSKLGNLVLSLPKCKIHSYTLKKFINKAKPKVWLIEIDRKVEDDYRANTESIPLLSAAEVKPNNFYVIHSLYASYNPEED